MEVAILPYTIKIETEEEVFIQDDSTRGQTSVNYQLFSLL